jgi:hypothetical protein
MEYPMHLADYLLSVGIQPTADGDCVLVSNGVVVTIEKWNEAVLGPKPDPTVVSNWNPTEFRLANTIKHRLIKLDKETDAYLEEKGLKVSKLLSFFTLYQKAVKDNNVAALNYIEPLNLWQKLFTASAIQASVDIYSKVSTVDAYTYVWNYSELDAAWTTNPPGFNHSASQVYLNQMIALVG